MSYQAQYNNQQLKLEMTLVATVFQEEQLLLPNCPEGILPAFLEIRVQWQRGQYFDAVGDYIWWSLSPKQQGTTPILIGDPDCIAAQIIESKGASAVIPDVQVLESVFRFPAPQLISYKSIWFQAISSHALTISATINWIPRQSRVPQRDNLVSQAQF